MFRTYADVVVDEPFERACKIESPQIKMWDQKQDCQFIFSLFLMWITGKHLPVCSLKFWKQKVFVTEDDWFHSTHLLRFPFSENKREHSEHGNDLALQEVGRRPSAHWLACLLVVGADGDAIGN
jgi:hypothetical protein